MIGGQYGGGINANAAGGRSTPFHSGLMGNASGEPHGLGGAAAGGL